MGDSSWRCACSCGHTCRCRRRRTLLPAAMTTALAGKTSLNAEDGCAFLTSLAEKPSRASVSKGSDADLGDGASLWAGRRNSQDTLGAEDAPSCGRWSAFSLGGSVATAWDLGLSCDFSTESQVDSLRQWALSLGSPGSVQDSETLSITLPPLRPVMGYRPHTVGHPGEWHGRAPEGLTGVERPRTGAADFARPSKLGRAATGAWREAPMVIDRPSTRAATAQKARRAALTEAQCKTRALVAAEKQEAASLPRRLLALAPAPKTIILEGEPRVTVHGTDPFTGSLFSCDSKPSKVARRKGLYDAQLLGDRTPQRFG
eukprot:NODE_1241_length_1198_cov_234.192476.p1 GENE.NODE_1241_length_1198_cov_234.192476~~NODE_1241_length_1198_cov_234.192476.p1  ORF type:complete len:316 (-),score=65.25 NODE_1241_length_1198_cov_234.192476:233-1180(-)